MTTRATARRDGMMQLRVNDTEKGLLARAAERQGLPVSAFLRMAALDRAREVLGKAATAGKRSSSTTRGRAAAPRPKNARKGARR